MYKYLLLFILQAPLFSFSQQLEFMQKMNSGSPRIINDKEIIPFQLYGHKIYIKTKINDSRDLNFLFDTGAITMVDEKIARELNIEKGIEIPSLDSLRKANISQNSISVSFGNVHIDNFIIVINDMPEGDESEPRIDGFIGSDILRFFCVTIDYQNQELIISTNKLDMKRPFYLLKLEKYFPLGFPLIHCKINSKDEVKVMIDTGSPFSMVCPISMVEDNGIFAQQKRLKSIGTFMKWPSTTTEHNYLMLAENLKFGELEIKELPIFFAELPKMFSIPLLGKTFLENFVTTINFIDKEVILYMIRDTLKITSLFSGLSVQKRGEKMFVRGIWEKSPADKCGIKVDDEIIMINEYEAKDLSIYDFNSILENDKIKEVRLKVKSDNKENLINMQKEEITSMIGN